VREAALTGLGRQVGHQADSRYVDALGESDYQLVMTAARLLDSTPDPDGAIPGLLGTLERITMEERETSRDPRMAILNTLATLAGPAQASTLRGYLGDFDPAIAQRAAELITGWTDLEVTPNPRRLPPTQVPTWRELTRLQDTRVVLEMSDGGRVVIALYPFDSPTNTARFVRMVRDGQFDGLTFHRVAPNFVVQGGSPNSNEYSGDGPYSRDELTLRSHLRGTVGISTRGRDTGDGQIFINLVDNIRLDHDYTIIGEIVEGMDLVDAFLEGATIARAVIR
jgi:cyclophilin family peptidyl-prolyl cis-trans isomerase